MKALEELREKLCKLLDEESEKKEVNTQWLENINRLTDSIKNIDKIIMLECSEMYDDGYSMRGGYMGGNSYANRGKHYVRGHYSRDGYDDDYSMRRDNRGRYSRDGGFITEHLRAMMDDADDKQREAIKRCLKELGE